jgi:hypothetical protein
MLKFHSTMGERLEGPWYPSLEPTIRPIVIEEMLHLSSPKKVVAYSEFYLQQTLR